MPQQHHEAAPPDGVPEQPHRGIIAQRRLPVMSTGRTPCRSEQAGRAAAFGNRADVQVVVRAYETG